MEVKENGGWFLVLFFSVDMDGWMDAKALKRFRDFFCGARRNWRTGMADSSSSR